MARKQYSVEEREDRVKALADKIEAGVLAIQSSEAFKQYLNVANRFHNYSFGNVLLILMQRPDASRVAGYTTWQKLGRQVRKGEKGIAIFAPHTYRRQQDSDDHDQDKTAVGFHVEHVFDVSQTDGPELPSFELDALQGDQGQDVYEAIAAYVTAAGITVTNDDPNGSGSYHGFYQPKTKTIFVRQQSPAHMVKTLVHEAAHWLDETVTKDEPEVRETVAEAAAYMVCQHYGMDTSSYSFGYIAHWTARKDAAQLIRSVMKKVQGIAHQLIAVCDQQMQPAEELIEA